MAERYDWDRDRERDWEMDRERGTENRDRDFRWNQGRHPEQGGRNQDWNRERENGRAGSSGDFNRQYRNREDAGRYSETGEQGDWGRQGNWGSFGNRPDYNRESNWIAGRQDARSEYERGSNSGRNYQRGGGSYQGHDRDLGGQYDRYPSNPNYGQGQGGYSPGQGGSSQGGSSYGSYGGGSYQGGMGSLGGGMGSYGDRGRFSGRGPKGWQRSDERIKEDVNERLTDHPHIDASEIEVNVKNGEVTLTGTAEDRNTKRQVEEVAEQVSGVKEVHNQIRVQENHQQPAMQGQGTSSSTGASGSSKK